MAPDQGLEDRVTCVTHHAAVPLHPAPVPGHVPGDSLPPVVPLLVTHHHPAPLHGGLAGEPPDVPELDALVLAVTDEVSAVSPGINVGDAISVTSQDTHGLRVILSESSPVPDHAHSVVPARRQHVGRLVHKADGVDVVLVGRDATGLAVGLPVVYIQTAVIRSTQQLSDM